MSAVQQASPIELSAAAETKIRELLQEEADDELCLRVFVTGGGCSGFQYGFTFDDERAEDDTLIELDGVRVLVDVLSYGYLVGSVLGYKEGLEGSRFVVTNPAASSTCGCGSSFSICTSESLRSAGRIHPPQEALSAGARNTRSIATQRVQRARG